MKNLLLLVIIMAGVLISACETVSEVTVPAPVIEKPIDTLTVYFTEDSSVLSQRARTKLRTLASAIQERDDTVQEIRVVGHVAHAGTDAGRRRISLERAERVAALLGDLGVVRPIRTTARSSDEPAESNDTEEGKALNRRAIIMVVQQ